MLRLQCEPKLKSVNYLEYAWLLPLAIIVVTVILLVTVIVLCEFRKRRNEQKLLMPEEE
jgi:cytochrome c-type biogenesis protein CcmH/NrfF